MREEPSPCKRCDDIGEVLCLGAWHPCPDCGPVLVKLEATEAEYREAETSEFARMMEAAKS